MRIETLTDWPERIEAGADVWFEGDAEPTRIERIETGGRTLVVYLAGIADPRSGRGGPSGATSRCRHMSCRRTPTTGTTSSGSRSATHDGAVVGELVEIFRAGENEVYRIVGPAGERLVPALKSVVLAIDLGAGRMTVADDDAIEVR